jgi:hypothetical protein
MRFLEKLRNSFQRSGLWPTVELCARALFVYAREQTPSRRRSRRKERQAEEAFDREFGVVTAGMISLAELKIPSSHRPFGSAYQATAAATFRALLESVPANLGDFIFVDFGSGLGRMLLLASEYPFRYIRGVEFSPELHQTACENIRRYASPTQKCKNIVSVCMDAAEYTIPPERAVFYFYNPFLENVMAKVLHNIEQSLHDHPRDVYIVYYNARARAPIDRSSAFRLLRETPTYCIYHSAASIASGRDSNPRPPIQPILRAN